MALRNPPSWLQNGSHPAENDRLTITEAIFAQAGILNYGDLKVSQSATPAMTVSVATGRACVSGSQTTNQGHYMIFNDAAATVALATASTTLPRIDRICATVQDAYYGGTANNQVIFQSITGTPNATPVAPAEPNNSITLALISVPANTTAIVDGLITDTRTPAGEPDMLAFATNVASDTLLLQGITSQTGKALKVTNQARNTTLFAINANGSITFPDGSTQTSAATYDPNLTVNSQSGTTYTLVAGDAQKLVTLSNASGITVTIASNATQALPVGTQVTLTQYGAGQITVVGASSPNPVTIVSTASTASTPKTRAQYSTMTLIQTSTDNWLAVGDIA